jgi:hypothetical protein
MIVLGGVLAFLCDIALRSVVWGMNIMGCYLGGRWRIIPRHMGCLQEATFGSARVVSTNGWRIRLGELAVR